MISTIQDPKDFQTFKYIELIDYKKPINQRLKINYPKRFIENYVSGYAVMIDWTEDRVFMQNEIEKAFRQRANNDKRRNSSPQMQRNTGE